MLVFLIALSFSEPDFIQFFFIRTLADPASVLTVAIYDMSVDILKYFDFLVDR